MTDTFYTRYSPTSRKIVLTELFNGLIKHGSIKAKKRVRFRDETDISSIYLIQPFLDYSSDLWWSKEELAMLSLEERDILEACCLDSSPKNISSNVIHMFMQAYRKARTQVYCESRLDHDLFQQLMIAKQNGYDDGFDRFQASSSLRFSSRQKHIRKTVTSIVEAYIDTIQHRSKISLSKYASNLTKGDSLWALYMAKIDAAVAVAHNCITNSPGVQSTKITGERNGLMGKKYRVTFWPTTPSKPPTVSS